MARQQWVPAEGTIVDVANALGHHEFKYTIEVRNWNRALIRREVKHKWSPPYTVGSRVKVEVSDDSQIRFDARHPGEAAIISTMNMTDQIQEAAAAFDRPGARNSPFGGPGGLMPFGAVGTFSGQGTHLGASGTTMRAFGPDGEPLEVDPTELKQLIRDIASGDPAAKLAARDRIQQLKAQRSQQAPSSGSGSGGSAGGGSGSGGQVFDQPPPGYSQPAVTDQRPAFGDGDAAGVALRLATLQNLLNTGILTQAEYETRRQQIISEI